jgi:hypothetical protein
MKAHPLCKVRGREIYTQKVTKIKRISPKKRSREKKPKGNPSRLQSLSELFARTKKKAKPALRNRTPQRPPEIIEMPVHINRRL